MIVKVRTGPNSAASIVKKLNTGAQIEAKGRTIIDGDLWFHISDGCKGQILRSTSNTAPLTCGACNTQPEGLLTMA